MASKSKSKTKVQPKELKEEGQNDENKFSDDGTRSFFWRAHTVTVLVLITSVLLYISLYDVPGDTLHNVRRGSLAVILVFILIGVIHMPDGPFIRPHPALWRFVLVIVIVYVLLLIFTLFQTADDARYFLTFYDPDLGVPLPERTYAEDCRIYTPDHPDGMFAHFMDKMDVFVLCHLLGWYVKALIVRDVWLLNIVSIAFELLEYTLECQLPNFGECWWDHWILDFAVCNGLGIYLGVLTCKYLAMKNYHWRGLFKIPSLKGKIKRAVGQFTPYNWEQFSWGYTTSFTRFVFVVILTIFFLLQELNVFYLKTILWVPPNHSLNLIREVIYAFSGACALHEMYHFLESNDASVNRIGRFSWLVFTALIVETLIVIKFGWEIITIPIPKAAVIGWSAFFVCLSIWAFWKFTYPLKEWPIIGHMLQSSKDNKKKD
ncbi:PREDICTED: phosphatidylserine synthase 2-like [Amphimedon queenslandica]|uniref:Phosphatidylserine synthase n=1 Tax=Amphimedon queenslandica TaxID=400682 RepID=A0A1X7V529_AMPQE|nr:PREDICTED: phosphatidylserine synthase 2-like [Amphimedon queenslandica]|eukprot:XP_003385624.1 PREDICTED: phosphatidylserine synthase 2-like [Amphimedon queenslandica]